MGVEQYSARVWMPNTTRHQRILVADSQGFNVGHPEAVAKSGRFITMKLEHANRHALQYCVDLIYARIDKYGNDIS
jgi:hypothetical protein